MVDVPIIETTVHEHFEPALRTPINNIALIRLTRPVEFTNWVKPLCLPCAQPLRNKNYADVSLVVAGFGRNENSKHRLIIIIDGQNKNG